MSNAVSPVLKGTQMNQDKNSKSKGFAGLLLILLVVILFAVVAGVYAVRTGIIQIPSSITKLLNINIAAAPSQVQKVDFPYTVKSITSTRIVLTGKNGDITYSNDPAMLEVFKGDSKRSPKMDLSELKVGDTVKVEFIPGKSATFFVS
jgi:hypothetical protein